MAADIENKQADTAYKRSLAGWEPWKVLISAVGIAATLMGAGAGLTLAAIALLNCLHSH
jgi:hypothetical protein